MLLRHYQFIIVVTLLSITLDYLAIISEQWQQSIIQQQQQQQQQQQLFWKQQDKTLRKVFNPVNFRCTRKNKIYKYL